MVKYGKSFKRGKSMVFQTGYCYKEGRLDLSLLNDEKQQKKKPKVKTDSQIYINKEILGVLQEMGTTFKKSKKNT